MPNQVSKSQFKARALEYFRRVETTGESLIVTDRGQPKLEIRPYQSSAGNPLDVLRGSVLRYDRPTDPVGDDEWDAQP
jgi:antitoxin (DNA-binding transcriptional repressor) of toxin-antitoxin stability system